jgi:hypothetical protein
VLIDTLASGGQKEAAQNIQRFIEWFVDLKPESIKSVEEWDECLKKLGLPERWEDHLEFVSVLKMFGVPEEEAKKVCAMPLPKAGKKMAEYVVRWFSKAVNGYKVNGCIVDAVNLIGAVLTTFIHDDVVETIDEFAKILDGKSVFQFAWIPDVIVNDGEMDDLLAVIIAIVLNKHVTVVTQVPKSLEDAKVIIERIDDEDSKNAKNFIAHKHLDIVNFDMLDGKNTGE